MTGKHKLLKSIAFIVAFSFVLNILPAKLTIHSYADQTKVFEDNRFIKDDGTKYIRIKDVNENGARVIIYEADPAIAFSVNYQPSDSKIIAEWDFAFGVVPEDFTDPDIEECIDEMLFFNDNEGQLALYLAPNGMNLYARDSTGDFISSPTSVTGNYRYVPFVTEETVVSEGTKRMEMPVDPSTLGKDWRSKVNLTQVGSIIVDEFGRIEKIGEKNFDEYYWNTTLKEIAKCCFIRFMGVAWVDEANIGNDNEYRNYHLNKRKPWADSALCKNSNDKDIVISTRRDVFLRQQGMKTNAELLYYYDSTGEKGFLGLYVENGSSDEEVVSLSWGESSVGYYFDNIDWYEMKNNKSGSWDVTVDEETNTILLEGEAEPTMHYTGGIAYHLSYKIWIYFNDDGTIDAEGYVIADGEGTEELIYGIKTGAVEFQTNSLIEKKIELVKKRYTYDVMEEIPGDSAVIPIYEATVTEIVPVTDIRKITHYDDWPDDTDPVDPNERRPADADVIYGYDFERDAIQYTEWEDINVDEPDLSVIQRIDDYKYPGIFMAVDATETSGAYLTLDESGYVMLLSTILDEEGFQTIYEGYFDYSLSKDADGIYDVAMIRMAFPYADAGHTYAEALYSEQYDMLFFLTPGFGEMGKDEFWEGSFERSNW